MDNTLGRRIATHRKRLGLTQEQLADKLGLTAQAVSKWENDQSCPDISTLPLLADIFGVSTDTLLGRVQIPSVINSSETATDYVNDDDNDADDDSDIHIHVDKNSHGHYKNSGKLYLLGTAVWCLAVGALYLLSKIFFWDCTLWDILWPSFLLVFGIFGLINHISLFWLACSSVGAFFLVSNIVPLPLELDRGILWAVIIIVCGVMLLLDVLRKKHRRKIRLHNDTPSHEYRITDGYLHCSNSFGEQNQAVVAELLTGGKVSNSFGSYTINLSGVDAVSDDCKIEVSCSFGEMELLVPKRYAVVHKSSKSFASFSVDGKADDIPEGQIFLQASVSFGDLTIRYI